MVHRIVKSLIAAVLLIVSFGVLALMIAMLVTRSSNNDCVYAALPPSLSFTRTNNNKDLTVSWYEAWPNAKCEVTYSLTYWIDDGRKNKRNISDPSCIINSLNLDICSILYIDLSAISEGGSVNEYYRTEEYIEVPENLEITNIEYNYTDPDLLITWMKPIELAACDLNYEVDVSTELDSFIMLSNSEILQISYDLYCFKITLNIIANIGSHFTTSAYDTYFEEGITQHVNFSVSPENAPELIVSWDKHFKHDLCMLEYHVVYSSEGLDDQSTYTAEPEARFIFEFCANAILIIETYGLERSIRGPTTVLDAMQLPSSPIGPVQDVYVEETSDNILAVSWLPADYYSYCDIVYIINAENPATGEIDTCTGTTECQISLSDFCPTTEVVIKASLFNGAAIDGVAVTEIYVC